MKPSLARSTWRALEPYHGMIYFAPEPYEEYGALGLEGRAAGYFPPRAAAMGAVNADVVEATFFNFSRRAVESGMSGAWAKASPEQVLAARYRGADRALRRLCGDLLDAPGVTEAVELARRACAGARPAGRPLFAAHAGLAWPDAPHLQLWHAITLLREFRGDGHIAALVLQDISGLESAVLHVAFVDTLPRQMLQTTRQYTDQEWDEAELGLRARGWLDASGALTTQGRSARQTVEDQTDLAAMSAWREIGEDGCARLVALIQPLDQAIRAGGGLPFS